MSIFDGYSVVKMFVEQSSGTVQSDNFYYLKAQDSGLTFPGYVFWTSYKLDYTDAPAPTGTYSNLMIVSAVISDTVIWT